MSEEVASVATTADDWTGIPAYSYGNDEILRNMAMPYNDNSSKTVQYGDLTELVKVIRDGAILAQNSVIEVDAGDGSGRKVRGVIIRGEKTDPWVSFPPEMNKAVERPDRIRSSVKLESVDSFTKYLNEHKNANTRVFSFTSGDDLILVAYIDFYGKGEPSFVTHTAQLVLKQTQEFARWRKKSGQFENQFEFAEFIAENTMDVVKPTGAELLELCRDLQGTQEVQFTGRSIEKNGNVRFVYDESTKLERGDGGRAWISVPETLELQIAPFVGMPPQKIIADFRSQLRKPNLMLGIIIRAIDRIIEQAKKQCQAIVETECQVTVFNGTVTKT